MFGATLDVQFYHPVLTLKYVVDVDVHLLTTELCLVSYFHSLMDGAISLSVRPSVC